MAGWWEQARLPVALVVVQTVFAGYQILSRLALDTGLSFLIFNFYRSAIALVMFLPAALIFERNTRPPLTLRLLLQFFALGFVGIYAATSAFLIGVGMSSAALGAAFQNTVPAFAFMVSTAAGMEKLNVKRRDGLAKILGTTLCMLGAMTITFVRGPQLLGTPSTDGLRLAAHTPVGQWLQLQLGVNLNWSEWQLGAVILFFSNFLWAAYLAMQTAIQKEYPAPLTILGFTYLFSALQFTVTAVFWKTDSSDWALHWGASVIGVVYTGVIASGFNYTLQAWCLKIGGTIMTAAFMPLQCLIATALAVIFLGNALFLGSVIGGVAIVLGLYFVVWGRAQELKISSSRVHVPSSDLEKAPGHLTTPLLADE